MNFNQFCKQFLNNEQLEILEKYNLLTEIKNNIDEYNDNEINIDDCIDQIQSAIQDVISKKVLEKEFLNPYKMTMIDPENLQCSLSKMVKNGCKVAVIEISSQGLEQNRHWGLGKFDIVSFLNLYPEHIESHGSFENYKLAKAKLFQNLKVDGIAVVNGGDKYAEEMLNFCPKDSKKIKVKRDIDYTILDTSPSIFKRFEINKKVYTSYFIADFEIENANLAAKIATEYLQKYHNQGFDTKILSQNYYQIPGRMEWVVWENKIC